MSIPTSPLAAQLGLDFDPTPEQARVIEYTGSEPALVIAGAGSGKTETMAQRVVWLVSTGRAAASEILGLTFTRKATAGLNTRILTRLRRLPGASERGPAALLDAPTISTYNAFANQIFRENALRVGYEADAGLLSESSAWQLAFDVVSRSQDPRILDLDSTPARVTGLVLQLAHAMTDHLVNPDTLTQVATELLRLREVPGPRYRSDIATRVDAVSTLPVLAELAQQYVQVKRERGVIEYADQVRLAIRALERSDDAVSAYRSRYRYVLLDEYQDTSVAQTRLLSVLFRGTPVMAVGDPHQSIYGWRGAAAGNLLRFPDDFSSPQRPRRVFTLSTSWRNDRAILEAANAVARPLLTGDAAETVVLTPGPQAQSGVISYREHATVDEEADAVADQAASLLEAEPGTSIAVLFRTRKSMPVFALALAQRGVPHHVVGAGGAMESPEVLDLRCTLAVLSDQDAGNELIRLLTGSRWRLGARDIVGLSSYARALAHAKVASARSSAQVVPSRDDMVSLVDALDQLRFARADSDWPAKLFSPVGFQRLTDAAELFARLRRASVRSLTDLVRLCEQELMLDVEVVANARNTRPRQNLDVLHAQVADYERTVPEASLPGLVGWLARVADQEDISPEGVDTEPGTVQLLTIHAAKGLEWDTVFLPRFVTGEYPGRAQDGAGWLSPGRLPSELRGDAADIPQFAWRECADTVAVTAGITEYVAKQKKHLLAEERRLLYVALTRARHRVLISAGILAAQRATGYARSSYLDEVEPYLTEKPVVVSDEDVARARSAVSERVETWPRDPLGQRRNRIEEIAAAVQAAQREGVSLPDAGRYCDDLRIVLAERDQAGREQAVMMPATIAASHLAAFVGDPETALRNAVRPVPAAPSAAAALGTAFHQWVEQRFQGSLDETLDLDGLEADDSTEAAAVAYDASELSRLQDIFLRSPWADQTPCDVEVAITAHLGGITIPCKLDAVFQHGDRFEIVDWKTGAKPHSAADLEQKSIQLALYRWAYAQWRKLDPERVDAAFFYVAADRVVRPQHLPSVADLAASLQKIRSRDERADTPGHPRAR